MLQSPAPAPSPWLADCGAPPDNSGQAASLLNVFSLRHEKNMDTALRPCHSHPSTRPKPIPCQPTGSKGLLSSLISAGLKMRLCGLLLVGRGQVPALKNFNRLSPSLQDPFTSPNLSSNHVTEKKGLIKQSRSTPQEGGEKSGANGLCSSGAGIWPFCTSACPCPCPAVLETSHIGALQMRGTWLKILLA